MAFKRIKPGKWLKKQTLAASELNQLDEKITSAFDLRNGETNDINADMTFAAGSSFTQVFSGGELALSTNNLILNNDLLCDAYIIGKTAQINFGYVTENITTNNHVCGLATRIAKIINFTGTLTSTAVVTLFTANQICEKIIINSTNKQLNISPNIGIPPNTIYNVYFDGAICYIIGSQIKANVEYIQQTVGSGAFNATISTIAPVNGWTNITSKTFNNIALDDIFEINYNVRVVNSVPAGICEIGIYYNSITNVISSSTCNVNGDKSMSANWSGHIKSITYNTSVVLGLAARTQVAGTTATIKYPLNLDIKHIRY